MDKTISIIRIAILFILGGIAMMLIFCEEQDTSLTAFIIHVIADKAIGITACMVAARLYKRWIRTDPWLSAYERSYAATDSTLPSRNQHPIRIK